MSSTSTLDVLLVRAANTAAAALDGRNLRLTRLGRVHAVGQVRWFGGVVAPRPLCHVGTSAGPVAGIIPTSSPITCARCAAALGVRAGQPPLDGLDGLNEASTA
jgi:hypothetical protein